MAQARHLLRLLTCPSTHPLKAAARRAIKRQRKKHRSPLQGIASATPAVTQRTYKDKPPAHAPDWEPIKHTLHDREDAIAAHDSRPRERGHAHIYTDGSKDVNGCGAAAAWPVEGGWRIARRALLTNSSIGQAETTGIELALLMAVESAEEIQHLHIWTDSQAAVRGLTKHGTSDPRAREVQDLWTGMEDSGTAVTLHWIPGHVGIEGNEKADVEVRAATALLVPRQEQRRGIRPSHVLHKLRKAATASWQDQFQRGKGTGLKKVLQTNEVGSARKRHSGLNRKESSLLTQLRTGHVALHGYLAQRKVQNDASCDCGHRRETVTHLLLSCPRWRRARQELAAEVSSQTMRSTRSLLDSKHIEVTRAVVRFAGQRLWPDH